MQLSVAPKPPKLKVVTQRTAAHVILEQLRAIYASRKLTQAKVEQQSGGKLKQTSVSRMLKSDPEDPGFNKLLWFAQAMRVDFLALVADATGVSIDQPPTVVAEIEALRADVGKLHERLDAALAALASKTDPEQRHGRGA